MQISTNYSSNKLKQNNPKFGALYMPEKKEIVGILGKYMAEEAEKERPFLEHLAHDADIFVQPKKDIKGMVIFVQDTTKPIADEGKQFAEIVKRLMQEVNPHFSGTVNFSPQDFGYKLYAKALSLKLNYNKLKKPNISYPLNVHNISPIDTNKTPTPYRKAS